MTEEEYAKHKQYAGQPNPLMHRRRVGHDYSSRRMYLITMTTEGRRPSPLGQRAQEEWFAVTAHHPEVSVVAFQLMPAPLPSTLPSALPAAAPPPHSQPVLLITADGLGPYSKPCGAFFDACAEGRLLILSPFEHQNQKVMPTRALCMQMNELASLIANSPDAASRVS